MWGVFRAIGYLSVSQHIMWIYFVLYLSTSRSVPGIPLVHEASDAIALYIYTYIFFGKSAVGNYLLKMTKQVPTAAIAEIYLEIQDRREAGM